MKEFYKAVPQMFLTKGNGFFGDSWEGIDSTGLDPKRAGCMGGATAISASVRKATPLDRNYTWLSEEIEHARSYAHDKFVGRNPVILKIVLPDSWVETGRMRDHGTAGWGTADAIGPECIYIESARPGNFIPIKDYNGKNAFITQPNSDSESDSEFSE